MNGWEMVVGLEVHAELRTKTKLFCGCPNSFGEEPNTSICPVCLGLPGSLPVLNRRAYEIAVKVGAALRATVQSSQFHRKNYFYPDMPKNYQISQYDVPITANGVLELPGGKSIRITRAHLEEDTGKLVHLGGGGRIDSALSSLIDYNRSGVPLLEIVSEPDISSSEEARLYVEELRKLLVAVDATDGRMEEGSLRVDANISVRPTGSNELRTRVEIKNLNSLRSLVRALEYEFDRQVKVYLAGGTIRQQTRHFDEETGETRALRDKEEANDYRYFPEPDLVPISVDPKEVDEIAASLPVLPSKRREMVLEREPDTRSDQLEVVVSEEIWPYLELALTEMDNTALAIQRAANELAALAPNFGLLSPERFVAVVSAEAQGRFAAQQTKMLLRLAVSNDSSLEGLLEQAGVVELSDAQLEAMVKEVLGEHQSEWQRYLAGDQKVGGYLLGQLMRRFGKSVPGARARAVMDYIASKEGK
jgi:aspartyl-tRNA(Asn)/glutamyl-tRNA(Gln) amidotransferase subunit B